MDEIPRAPVAPRRETLVVGSAMLVGAIVYSLVVLTLALIVVQEGVPRRAVFEFGEPSAATRLLMPIVGLGIVPVAAMSIAGLVLVSRGLQPAPGGRRRRALIILAVLSIVPTLVALRVWAGVGW